MSTALLSLVLAAGTLPGWPRPAGGPISQAAVPVQLDGEPAALVVAGDALAAFRADGQPVPGFPVALGAGEVATGAPAAADRGGRPDVAVVTGSGKVFLFSGASPVKPFPRALGARARAGASFADVDGDGKPEIVVGDARGRLHALRRDGEEAKGWPVDLGAAVTSTATTGRFGGGPSLAVGCADGKVHVLDLATRKDRAGFPLRTGYEVTGAPAFADLDGDGEMDLVVASQDFKLYAVDGRGAALPGFPVEAGYRIYEGPAVGDLDGEGKLSVAFTSADGLLHVVDAAGAERPGFPVKLGGRVFGGAVMGDLDRDGHPDVAAVSADGNVVAVDREGGMLAGFPTRFEATDLGASPALLDLGGDQSLSLVVGFPSGDLHAVRALRFGTVAARAPWPMPGHDAARTGHAAAATSYHALALEPAAPRTGEALRARWRWAAPDAAPGSAEPPVQIDWYRNGAIVADLSGKREVPPRRARKGEVWRFALVPANGTLVYRSPEVRVADTPPTAPELALDPPRPAHGVDVKAVLARPAQDDDGDEVSYRWEWLLDGLPTGVTAPTFPGDRLRKGMVLTARAVASDGEAASEAGSVEARVVDTPPEAVTVALTPAAPRRGDAVAVTVAAPPADADGDEVVLRYRWTVDGEPRNLPVGTARLPPATLRKGQRVAVEVRAFDGELEGPPARAEAVVANTPPGAPAVEIRPAAPRRGDALRAVLAAAAPDADGDALTYRWIWRKNGQPYATRGDPREVPGRDVARGDRFEVEVWAGDGEAEGPHATAAAVVGGTPPSAPRLALDPPWPAGGAALQVKVLEESRHADGDPVHYDWRWTVNGKPVPGANGPALPVGAARKHARVRVTVTPYGGLQPGAPVSAEVEVANAPPGAPEVALPPRPVVGTPLAVTVTRPATDPDGDPITYRYRWLRDGFAVPVPDATAESRRDPYWTSLAAVPAAMLVKGQRWTVEVQAFDGEAHGPVARAEAIIANSPPPAPAVAFLAKAPRRGDGLRLAVTQPPDADGDVVTWRYTWWRDGKKQDLPREQAEVARGVARRGERWRVEVVATDGEDEAPPVVAEVVVANTPPGAPALALCDRPVAAGTPLEVRLREPARDGDGDAVTYRYAWTVNGKPLPGGGQGQAKLPGGALKKHDVARVVVTAFDGTDAGPEAAAECEVENTPPTRPEIALEPREPTALTGVKVVLRTPATDRDGDPVIYHYAWWRDGVLTDLTAPQLLPGAIRHGERWQVAVRAFDWEAEGEPAVASAEVVNTPPPAPAVMVLPEAPAAGQALSCRAAVPPTDADGEVLELRYRWFRDGEPVPLGEGRPEIPAEVLRRGEAWRCEAWASDGTVEGPRAHADVKVRNSPPTAPEVAIEPEAPRRGDALACRIAVEAEDPDGDRVTYRYAWTVDGAPAPAGPDPARVAPDKLRKGQKWRCLVTASDGELATPAAWAERRVADSPPGPARVRVVPAAPTARDPLRCEIAQKSEDPDGDPVRYTYAWFRNGDPQSFAATTDEVPVRLLRAGDRWRCVATPSDGELSGPPSGSAEVTVRAAAGEPISRSTP